MDRRRRALLQGLGLASLGLLTGGCEAQELLELLQRARPETRRLGGLLIVSPVWPLLLIDVITDLATIEGKYLDVTNNFAWGLAEQPTDLAQQVAGQLRAGVTLVLAVGTPAIQAAAAATKSVPIVGIQVGDGPDGSAVERLAQAAGNLTGVVAVPESWPERQLELLKRARPEARRVGLLWRPDSTWPAETPGRLSDAAGRLGLELAPFELRSGSELEQVVGAARRAELAGLVLLAEWQTSRYFLRLAELTANGGPPLIAPYRRCSQLGALLSFGPNLSLVGRAAAEQLRRVLDGAAPGSLPLQQVKDTELVVNPLAARRAGFSLPPELVREAVEVVEAER